MTNQKTLKSHPPQNRFLSLGRTLAPAGYKPKRNWPIFLKPGPVDFRKGINGLASTCQASMGMKPTSGALFVFCNKGRNRIKLLLWDRNGWWLCLKRLEEGKFAWPTDGDSMQIDSEQMRWLLDGVDFFKTHRELKY